MLDLLLIIGLLFVLLFLSVPIAWALLITGSVGLIHILGIGPTLGMFTDIPHSTGSKFLFATIPMFILMAFFLSESDITEDMFTSLNMWLHNVRGGVAMATIVASGGMAALSGSSVAGAASMARISVPELRKYNYDDRMSMGIVASAGTFAIMIPPSLGLILYGIITETGIADLFIAGIIPGLLTIISYIGVVYTWLVVNPEIGATDIESYSLKEKVHSLGPIYPAVILIVIVLGGLYGGVMTPTEAGAIGAAGALAVGVLFSNLRLPGIIRAGEEAVRVTTMVFMILIGALIFARFLTVSGITSELISFVGNLPLPNVVILLMILAVYLIMGMFMSQSAILILTLPLTFPLVVTGLGYNSIWFGVLLVKVAEVGMVTPPLGLNVYVASSTMDVDVETTFAGVTRFIIADLVILFIMIAFPETVLWLV